MIANGAERIIVERQRQIDKEGWTPEHDLEHGPTPLIMAAASYMALEAGGPPGLTGKDELSDAIIEYGMWPWEPEAFKPGSSISNLTKAGALIAAALDVLYEQEKVSV